MKRASARSELEVKPERLSTNEVPVGRTLPEWYLPGPFLHDVRILAFSFVCLTVVLLLSGEMLLTVLALGSLVIHIIDNVGAKQQAVAGYLCVFIAAELTVIYSAIPLLWVSLYNVILIFALNAFVVFTGGWVLLHFDAFLQVEPSLTVFIETSLFTFYPGICIIVMSWMVAQALSISAVPYGLVVFGFISGQLFLPQHPSSFHKSKPKQSLQSVLCPVEVTTVLMIYNIIPMQSFIFINFWSIFELKVFLKFIFVISCPVFLTTLLDVHYVLEYYEISLRKKTIVRWVSGLISLTIIYFVTYLDNLVSSGLLSWLPVVLMVTVLLGIFMSQKKTSGRKIMIVFLACGSCILYISMILSVIPTNLVAWGVITKVIWLLLACNAALTVACVITAAVSTKEHLSDLLLCSVAVLVFSEHQFLSIGLYSHGMLAATIAIECYTFSRLQNAGKVSWYVTWLSMGMHATKFPVIIESQLNLENSHHITASPIVDKLFIAMFILAVSKLFFFESRHSVPLHHAIMYAFSITILSLLVTDSLLQPLFIMISHIDFNTAGSIALVLLTSGILLLKLTMCHMTKFKDAKTLNMISILLGVFIFVLQPSSDATFSNICNILLLVSFLVCIILFLTRSPRSHHLCLDLIYSLIIGGPLGLKAYQLLINSEHFTFINITIYLLASSLTTFVHISVLLWSPSTKNKNTSTAFLPSFTIIISVLFLTIYILEYKQIGSTDKYTNMGDFYGKYSPPCTKVFMLYFLSVAVNLKSLLVRITADNPFGVIYPSSLPTAVNLATLLSYTLLVFNYPPDILPELWACVCSVVFLLITKDNLFFSRIEKLKKPGIVFTSCVVVLYIATLYENSIWKIGVTFRGLLELFIGCIVSPVFYSVCAFVLNRFYVMRIKLVVFLSPVCVLLALFGTSPASCMLGSLGLVSGLGSSYLAVPSSDVVDNLH